MFKQENRLKKKKDFDNVFQKGKTIAGKLVFLKIKKNNLNINRIGFIIGLKISKKAVVRNKIKRQLREIIRENISNIKQGFDIVAGVNLKALNEEFQEIKKDTEKLLKKIS